ncbi:phosphotransferase [Alkalihalobacterium alkalinitrilicum]|uniref:phosphotransferase n=1 Tax=Alkalihalobacterium alkalinitrilicum TaxID=427920 RepID=UPI0009959F98|nr:aminoglycoside phosphotransferase family protein [Alkalihalobacterium alkalinitrilicum]
MIDINDQKSLYEYLYKRGLVLNKDNLICEVLSGGISCKVVKITTESTSFVIKQARSKLQVENDWYSDIRRIYIERDCLNVFNEIIPEDAPKLLYHDDDNYLIVMEAAPANALSWKQQLMIGKLDFKVTEKIAVTLAIIHSKAAQDEQLKQQFNNKEFFKELRISPYLETIREKYKSLSNDIDRIINMLLKDKTTLVHGDFSPKNILIVDQKIFLLDHEVAHTGHPAFDLAFITNHFLLKSIKNKKWANGYMNLMLCFVEQYLSSIDFMDRNQLERETIRVLALLLLARVDGKSPAEYITDEHDQDLIRSISLQILELATSYIDVARIIVKNLTNKSFPVFYMNN